jgi:hypothetical protein
VTYVDLRPDNVRPVQVLVDGNWWDGELEAYDQVDGVWRGYARWSQGISQTYIRWFTEAAIRPA